MLFIPVDDDHEEYECASVMTSHTQDVKCVAWHPHKEVNCLDLQTKKHSLDILFTPVCICVWAGQHPGYSLLSGHHHPKFLDSLSFWAGLPILGFQNWSFQVPAPTLTTQKLLDFVIFSQASGIGVDKCIQTYRAQVAHDQRPV